MSPAPRPLQPGDHVFLVDGSSFVFRAYFQSINQDRKYNFRSDRLPTGAVRLFCTKLFQFIREGAVGIRPTHLAIIFDKSEDSFRKELYPAYKANRSAPPDELIPQFPLMREAVKAFGLIPVEMARYEADDLIATYARQAAAAGAEVLIVSADKDLMQVVGERIAMYDPASGEAGGRGARPERRIGVAEVLEYFGVPPEQVTDVQALAGDSTDNVPGVPGIGIKTASSLVQEFGNLEQLLARTSEIKQPKRRQSLEENAEAARISKTLVTLVTDVPVEVPLADLVLEEPDGKRLIAFLKAMEFTTITRRAAEAFHVEASEIEADPTLAPAVGSSPHGLFGAETDTPTSSSSEPTPTGRTSGAPQGATGRPDVLRPADLAAARAQEARATKLDRSAYRMITDLPTLQAWCARAVDQGFVALAAQASSIDPQQADLVGISLALAPNEACYIPLAHLGAGDGLFSEGLQPGQIPMAEALAALKGMLEDRGTLKIGHSVKFDAAVLARYGIALAPYDSTLCLSYVLDAGRGNHGLEDLSVRHLGHQPIALVEVAGKGKGKISFDKVPLEAATPYAAEDADVTLRLWRVLKPRLPAEGLTSVYETLERPLIPVLARMEARGISIDRAMLSRLSGEFAQGIARIEDEIADLAGERLNVGSPKQMGDILFGKMGLPGATKTPTGAWSTKANVLEELAEAGHPLPQKILEWRQLSKLRSTYTDALPNYVNPRTRRVHTSYAQAATTTGRLSSSEPNLQNIPVRTEDGRKIRTAFVAPAGKLLISADYSQIELRVLAHIADIQALKDAFEEGLDIHAMTASEMFGVPVEGMPSDVRRRAKAINFGIIYGISAFGLANQLGIGRSEAGDYIKAYFAKFPGIRDYMETQRRLVKAQGYVTTIFGRKIGFENANTSNPSERAFIERASINAPIQGSAADIIRRAMIRMEGALKDAGAEAAMLLQVHDELIFEVDEARADTVMPVIVKTMETAAEPALQLTVPIKVDAHAAKDWDGAH